MNAASPVEVAAGERQEHKEVVEVWTVNLDVPDPMIAVAAAALSPDELDRAAAYRNDTARHRYILSHGALRQILSTHLGQAAPGIIFNTGQNEKPALAEPGKSRLEFNLTHSGGLALVAISHGAAVGVDVEGIRPMRDAVAIARRFFSPREAAVLEAMDAPERSAAFFNVWTRKEALVKATGQGIAGGLARFEVSWDANAVLHSVDGNADQVPQWSLHSFNPAPGYLAAVAVQRPGVRVIIREFIWR